MLKLTLTAIAASLLVLCLGATVTRAQPTRVFVAAQGSDGNPCTFALPCRTFQHAHDTVAASGEIDVLDPAGYGALTINKAISIQGHGFAGIAVASGNGIIINAGAGDRIGLRGLLIDGAGVGSVGIVFSGAGASLTVQDCVVRGFTSDGIDFLPNAASSLVVSHSFVGDNPTGLAGILVLPTGSGVVSAVFDHVELANNTVGLEVSGEVSTGVVKVTVTDSVAAQNGGPGLLATTTSTRAPTSMMVFRSVAANNGTGIQANGLGAIVRIGQSALTGNANGWQATTGGLVRSYGDNKIDGNTANESPPTAIPGK